MASTGQGVIFQYWDTSGTPQWIEIANITSIGGPSMSRDTIDTTVLNNTDGYRTFIAALRDSGSLNLTMHFSAANYELIKGHFESQSTENYRVFLPSSVGVDNSTFEIEGLVSELPLSVPVDDLVTCEVVIKIVGEVVFTYIPTP